MHLKPQSSAPEEWCTLLLELEHGADRRPTYDAESCLPGGSFKKRTQSAFEMRRGRHQIGELVKNQQQRIVDRRCRECVEGVVPVAERARRQIARAGRHHRGGSSRKDAQLVGQWSPRAGVGNAAPVFGELLDEHLLADPAPTPDQADLRRVGSPPALQCCQLFGPVDEPLHDARATYMSGNLQQW